MRIDLIKEALKELTFELQDFRKESKKYKRLT